MVCIAVLLMWIQVFYWLRLFDNTSFYYRLVRETIVDLGYFLIIFITVVLTFANILWIALTKYDIRDENG